MMIRTACIIWLRKRRDDKTRVQLDGGDGILLEF
jgi:hypothetical protein